jgi:hypothetical protein
MYAYKIFNILYKYISLMYKYLLCKTYKILYIWNFLRIDHFVYIYKGLRILVGPLQNQTKPNPQILVLNLLFGEMRKLPYVCGHMQYYLKW